MTHNITLENLLTIPGNNSTEDIMCKSKRSDDSKLITHTSRHNKRRQIHSIFDCRKTKCRHRGYLNSLRDYKYHTKTDEFPSKELILPKNVFNHTSFSRSCPNESQQLCYTKICPKKLEFTWTIENFSLSASSPGEIIVSRSFPVPSNEDYVWSLHVAPHGKSPELRDYISVCLVMESKKQPDVCSSSMDGTQAATSLIPARFRCSLLDLEGRIAYTNETERYHLVGPKMGLGFCRFVERSRLYPHPTAASKSSPTNQKGDRPSMDAVSISSENALVGSNDIVQFFAEIFWVEEEIYTSTPLSLSTMSKNSDWSSNSKAHLDLHNDLEDLLISQRLADIKVTIESPGSLNHNCDMISRFVDIKDNPRVVDCDCCNCSVTSVQTSQEFFAHKAILAASAPKLMEILSSPERSDGIQGKFTRLVFRGSGLSPDVVPSFLQYVYSRKIDQNLGHAQLVTLLRLSSRLEMQEFTQIIVTQLTGILSTINVCSILATAIDLKTPSLIDSCLSHVFRNTEHIIDTTSYQSLCDHRSDVLSFLLRQMACRKKNGIAAIPSEPSPAPSSLVPRPRAFTFGDSPVAYHTMLMAAPDLPLAREVSKQHQRNQSSMPSFSLSLQASSTNSELAEGVNRNLCTDHF